MPPAAVRVVGRGCRIGRDAAIDGAILWPEVTVGAGARVGRALIGRRVRLGEHVEAGAAVLGDDSHLTDYSRLASDDRAPTHP